MKNTQTGCPACGAEFHNLAIGAECPNCRDAVVEDESWQSWHGTGTKATHTAGPWHIDGKQIVGGYPDSTGAQTHICDINSAYTQFGEDTANATLIAAAPELLARLRECVDYLYAEADNAEDRNNGLIAECEAAIRKATGGDE